MIALAKIITATHPHEPVLGLKLLLRFLIIVDQTKTGRRTATELSLETENGHTLLVGLVKGSKLLRELRTRDVGAGGVEDSEDKLSSVEETVGDELGGSEGDGAFGVL